jgi:hypothetical protein
MVDTRDFSMNGPNNSRICSGLSVRNSCTKPIRYEIKPFSVWQSAQWPTQRWPLDRLSSFLRNLDLPNSSRQPDTLRPVTRVLGLPHPGECEVLVGIRCELRGATNRLPVNVYCPPVRLAFKDASEAFALATSSRDGSGSLDGKCNWR